MKSNIKTYIKIKEEKKSRSIKEWNTGNQEKIKKNIKNV